jgi:hypothetical protein
MKTFATILALSAAVTTLTGANLPGNTVRGNYIEARSADVYTGPCFAMSELNLVGDLGIVGWQIEKGTYDGVRIDGLSVVGVVKANATLGDSTAPVVAKSVIIVDEKATLEQRIALQHFAQHMGGELLADVVKVDVQPIEFTIGAGGIHARKVSLTAGTLARIQTRALVEGDQLCHNESAFYPPLTAVEHAMPAYTESNMYSGTELNTRWKYSGSRASFVGTFRLDE